MCVCVCVCVYMYVYVFVCNFDFSLLLMGVRDQFRLGGLRSVARIFFPLLARKSNGFARILQDFFFCPNMAI